MGLDDESRLAPLLCRKEALMLYHVSDRARLTRLDPAQPKDHKRPFGVYLTTSECVFDWVPVIKGSKETTLVYIYEVSLEPDDEVLVSHDSFTVPEYRRVMVKDLRTDGGRYVEIVRSASIESVRFYCDSDGLRSRCVVENGIPKLV